MQATNPKGRPAQFDRSTQNRRSMIAKIQIARQQLAMDEDDYRQIVYDKTGRTSLKEASDQQLIAVLDVMKAKGFRPLPKKSGTPVAQHPMARKARALWISLHHLGVVNNPNEPALEAFACRQLGCEKLVWARQSDAYKLIEALKNMAVRNGWAQSREDGRAITPLELQRGLCEAILARLKRNGVAARHWTIDNAAWSLCGVETARANGWTAEDYAGLARQLGQQLRTHGIVTDGGQHG